MPRFDDEKDRDRGCATVGENVVNTSSNLV